LADFVHGEIKGLKKWGKKSMGSGHHTTYDSDLQTYRSRVRYGAEKKNGGG
jgi:hypothetical protein